MTSKENAKTIREELRRYFGKSSVSVTIGSGTARPWVHVSINIERPKDCDCISHPTYGLRNDCLACSHYRQSAVDTANMHIEILKQTKRIHLATYSQDDGFGNDHDCLLLQVRYA